MKKLLLCIVALTGVSACASVEPVRDIERGQRASDFLRGVYGGDTAVVDNYAAPDIVLSYPVFEKIFGAPQLQGRDAVKKFIKGFSKRWVDATVTVRKTLIDGDSVVLIWEFRARRADVIISDEVSSDGVSAWGGITYYRFDADGRIVEEIGEESTPGPAARVPRAFQRD